MVIKSSSVINNKHQVTFIRPIRKTKPHILVKNTNIILSAGSSSTPTAGHDKSFQNKTKIASEGRLNFPIKNKNAGKLQFTPKVVGKSGNTTTGISRGNSARMSATTPKIKVVASRTVKESGSSS